MRVNISADRKKKLHRLLATSSSEDDFESNCGGIIKLKEKDENSITPIDCNDVPEIEKTFNPILSQIIIANEKRCNDFKDDDIENVEYRPYVSTDTFPNNDATIELPFRNDESRLINRYIARNLISHQVEGVKWLWEKYALREGAILGYQQ
jgi:SNF2 family DNA or RNA helicase